jgi:hypothetical protein
MNPLSTLFASIVAIIIFTLVPVYRTYWIIDQQVYKYVNLQTQEFANDIRHKGYIDNERFEAFIKALSNTENVYDINIVHIEKIYHPLQATDPGYTPDHTFTVIEEAHPLNAIMEGINSSPAHQYRMHQGDTISVEVVNKSKTGTMVFIQALGGKAENSLLSSRAGGMVTNEDY